MDAGGFVEERRFSAAQIAQNQCGLQPLRPLFAAKWSFSAACEAMP